MMPSTAVAGRSKSPFITLLSVTRLFFLFVMILSQQTLALMNVARRQTQQRLPTSLSLLYTNNNWVVPNNLFQSPTLSTVSVNTARSHGNLFYICSNSIFSRTIHVKSSPLNTADDNHDDDDLDTFSSDSSSVLLSGDDNFALDPQSDLARNITRSLGISDDQHDKLTSLACLVVEWNERLNLISRKECSIPIVFGRHILPSIAIGAVAPSSASTSSSSATTSTSILSGIFAQSQESVSSSSGGKMKKKRIIDVGTGGGFPGLPLAILFPHVEFLLIDSIGKKLKAIEEMAQALNVTNVRTYHGRVEEMSSHPIHGLLHKNAYDFCVGRSVAALPTFCFWIQDLLKVKDGQLLYIIGGEIDPVVQSRISRDIPINHIFDRDDVSDKRILMFPTKQVLEIAARSGEKKRIVGVPKLKSKSKVTDKDKATMSNRNRSTSSSQGAWKKRDNSIKKDRGYEDFKRYES